MFGSIPIKNIEQSRNDRNAAAMGCTMNTNIALSAMLPWGLPTGMTPHHITAPMPGTSSVTKAPHLKQTVTC